MHPLCTKSRGNTSTHRRPDSHCPDDGSGCHQTAIESPGGCQAFPGSTTGGPVSFANVETIILESCHSTWVLDPARMRFRRILKHIEVGQQPVATDWRPYFQVHIDPHSERFTVSLNADGSRLIQSWRHTHDCAQCGGHVTAELSLNDVRSAVGL